MILYVQEVFDKVIDAGLYWADEGSAEYMCHALQGALRQRIISHAECTAAEEAIQEYMHNIDPLSHALFGALLRNLRHALTTPAMREGNLTELYRDWANRPMP